MTARLRIILAASACLLAAMPALAQDAAQQQPGAPAERAVIGPPQLSNFSLNGTVTRAAPAPAPVPAQKKPVAAPPKAASATPGPKRTDPAPATPKLSDIQTPRPARTLPDPRPEVVAPSEPVADAPAAIPDSLPAVPEASPATPSRGLPILPWIIAALAAAGAAAWFFFFRTRNRESYAGVSGFDLAPEVPPRPVPPAPAQPRAAPEPVAPPPPPPPAAPSGVVRTQLRPWLEIEFRPDRAVVDDNRAAVAFELSVLNSGAVVARDILLEASLFNAGPAQDQQIQLFFDNPVGKGDRIPAIPPLQRITVETAVFMARDQVRPIEIEGRPLFVPMIAFNALYRWNGTEGQTSASFLVGKGAQGEKLAPFRLDLGPRIFRGLDAREHALKVRT